MGMTPRRPAPERANDDVEDDASNADNFVGSEAYSRLLRKAPCRFSTKDHWLLASYDQWLKVHARHPDAPLVRSLVREIIHDGAVL